VLSERGEIEGASAASGVLWSGGRAAPFAVPPDSGDEGGDDDDEEAAERARGKPGAAAIREALTAMGRPRSATALVFARPESFSPELLDGLLSEASRPLDPRSATQALDARSAQQATKICVFGAGTVGSPAMTLSADGKLATGPLAGLLVSGLAPPIVESTPACRLLCPFAPIEEASGGLVLRVGGRSALDLLSSLTSEIGASKEGATSGSQGAARAGSRESPQQGRGAPIVFAAIAEDEPGPDGRERYLVRPVRGIDPSRGAVMIGREARVGVRFAFGVRDASAARAGLEAAARSVATSALGAAPRFAIYLTCAGRGHSLYGATDVEARILRQRFGDLPIAGMHSSFEIVPSSPESAKLALYTGVLALFRSPS
jgi:small ligand-binding sensory domain FIST